MKTTIKVSFPWCKIYNSMLLFLFTGYVQAQVEVISYKGGSNDGYHEAILTQPIGPQITYKGGNNDGYSEAKLFNQGPVITFKGGFNDGFAEGLSMTMGPVITFKGGKNDGFSQTNFLQPLLVGKTGSYVDANANGVVDIGDVVNYSFSVTNIGTIPLTNITLSDPLPGIVISGNPLASLAPGATNSSVFTATYAITATDITAGIVSNQAIVTAGNALGNFMRVSEDDNGSTDNNGDFNPFNDPTVVALILKRPNYLRHQKYFFNGVLQPIRTGNQ